MNVDINILLTEKESFSLVHWEHSLQLLTSFTLTMKAITSNTPSRRLISLRMRTLKVVY